MIAFATLFLGLVLGPQPVEVVVGDRVAAVEILLNGRSHGVIRGAPWSMPCDFGPELAPQKLEAVAYDAAERELGRVRQWLNVPHPPAMATIVLEPHQLGQPRIARLTWESVAGVEPLAMTASLDGQPLAVDDPRRIVLPPHDPQQLHLFRAEIEFEDHISSQVELTFGGTYIDQIHTELTAIPVMAKKKSRKPPPADRFQGWFLRNGEPVKVVAVEKAPADVVMVLNRPYRDGRTRYLNRDRRHIAKLTGGHRLRFLVPVPRQRQGARTQFDLFPISRDYPPAKGGVYWLLFKVRQPGLKEGEPHLAEAVAVAGLAASARRRGRAVVLILRSEPHDAGLYTPAQTRRYLQRLRVPFFLWTPDEQPSPALAEWGEPVDVSSISKLVRAVAELDKVLDHQWVVWLEGTYLPQEITLSPAAEGITLVP